MSWITIDDALIARKLAGPEDVALRTAALKSGQSDPTAETLADVIREVRGYVAANPENKLGEGVTIPDELLTATLNRVRYELATRLPVKSFLTDARVKSNDAATALLRDVAAGRFRIEQPATVSDQVISGPAVQVVSSTTRNATRSKLSGL